jgi:hypothetical protein
MPYTLALEVPVPPQYQTLFDATFAELKQRPGVTIINGY